MTWNLIFYDIFLTFSVYFFNTRPMFLSVLSYIFWFLFLLSSVFSILLIDFFECPSLFFQALPDGGGT